MNEIDKALKALKDEILQDGSEEQKERLEEILKNYEGEDRIVSSQEIWEEYQNLPQKPNYKTGFKILDETMQGFETGATIVLTGITKHGKTTFAVELSERLKELNPLWLSLEERHIDLIKKFKERTGQIPQFYTPKLNERPTLEWVEMKLVESRVKYGSKVAFIDHLGFISDAEYKSGENEAQRLERISRRLHTLAVQLDYLIFNLWHLRKTNITTNPTLDDIRGSSAVAQEADAVFIIWRETKRVGGVIEIGSRTNLSIQANRRSGKPNNIIYEYEKGRYIEIGEHTANAIDEEFYQDW